MQIGMPISLNYFCLNGYVIAGHGMGIADTRVTKKNGQLLMVLTPAVEKMAKEFQTFKGQMTSDGLEEEQ